MLIPSLLIILTMSSTLMKPFLFSSQVWKIFYGFFLVAYHLLSALLTSLTFSRLIFPCRVFLLSMFTSWVSYSTSLLMSIFVMRPSLEGFSNDFYSLMILCFVPIYPRSLTKEFDLLSNQSFSFASSQSSASKFGFVAVKIPSTRLSSPRNWFQAFVGFTGALNFFPCVE